jgi:hypothetical protein
LLPTRGAGGENRGKCQSIVGSEACPVPA